MTRTEIERDVARMFSGNFREWVGLASREAGAAEKEQLENSDMITAY